ncbi:plasmid recombination protein [Holzapfeliella sp. JNUCC 80]
MTGIISVNVKKIKATTKVNRLLDENYRTQKTAQKYDDGKRIISTDKTVENIFLLDRPENFDRTRKERFKQINLKRSQRRDTRLDNDKFKCNLSKQELRKLTNQNINKTRKLRSDTVDLLGLVIQPDAEFINRLNRDEQIKYFDDALSVLQDNYTEFGAIATAVIHFDENTPHMQVLSSVLNEQTLKSDASFVVGNKSKLSNKQDIVANGMKAKGWNVKRGIKRIDNPDYQNFKSELTQQGFKLNRYNDKKLMQDFTKKKERIESLTQYVSEKISKKDDQQKKKSKFLDNRESKIILLEEILKENQSKHAQDVQKFLEWQRIREKKLKEKEKKLNKLEKELQEREKNIVSRESKADDRDFSNKEFLKNVNHRMKDVNRVKEYISEKLPKFREDALNGGLHQEKLYKEAYLEFLKMLKEQNINLDGPIL